MAPAPRRLPYVAVAIVAVLDVVFSVRALLSTRDLATVEGLILVSMFSMTSLLAAGVGLWISLRSPGGKDVLALAVGLVGVSCAVSLSLGPVGRDSSAVVLGLGRVAVVAGNVVGSLGLLRFFTLFRSP